MSAIAEFWTEVGALRTLLDQHRRAEAEAAMTALAARAARDDPGLFHSRLALLTELAALHGLPAPCAPASHAPLRLMVSGIGRSGTTLIFQQLAKLLLLDRDQVNFRYEPYLWNIRTPGTAGNAFGMEQFHHFGLHTHLSTPLFLKGAHSAHDPFLDHLFAEPWDGDAGRMPGAYLAKVIRGSGRLRAYLGRFPDLKIAICLRNPVDTINSSLGMFSFFGEEFHANDRARFAAELADRGVTRALPADAPNAVEWYGAWWRAFTEESLAVAKEFPDNVFLFCHELFQRDNAGVLDALAEFVGIDNLGMRMGLDQPAGPSIKATSLTPHDLGQLAGDSDFYQETVLTRFLGGEEAAKYARKQARKYGTGTFSFPIAGTDLGRKSTIQLRGMMLRGVSSPFQRLATGPRSPVQLAPLLKQHAPEGTTPADLRLPLAAPGTARKGRSYGVVITCHNNADTVADAVLSCLNQTLPYDQILVVDDKSTDTSPEILAELADRYSAVRVVTLESSLGPAAARDLGFRRIDTDFITQLDGDDQFWPTKHAGEVAALDGDDTAVAFSDILLVLPDKSFVQSTASYAGPADAALFTRMLSRQVQIPRDMTLSRARYFQAGGYDLLSHLYEDWDFKLRLAALGGQWRRADSVAGTVYNRLSPGLSGVEPGRHARALVTFFCRALAHGTPAPDTVLAAFDAALRPFADRHITRAARGWLAGQIASGRYDAKAIAVQMSGRGLAALDNVALAARFEAETPKVETPEGASA
jgi:hypothetical protein